MVTPAVEQELWKSSQVKTISQLTAFPFPSHAAFRQAVLAGQASVGIEYAAARDLAHITKSPGASYVILGLSWVPFLLAIASVILPFTNGQWLALGGVVSALVGMSFASPHNPLKTPSVLFSVLAVAYGALTGSLNRGAPWVAFAFGASCLSIVAVNRVAWSWAKNATLGSEAFAAYLFRTGNLHVRDSKGQIHTHKATA